MENKIKIASGLLSISIAVHYNSDLASWGCETGFLPANTIPDSTMRTH